MTSGSKWDGEEEDVGNRKKNWGGIPIIIKGAVAHGISSLPKYFVFTSLCSFICLQAVYQLSGPVCKSTWNCCPSCSASHLHFTLCDRFLVHLKSYNLVRDRYR